LIDSVWEDRPLPPSEKVFILDEKYAGESVQSKYDRIAAAMPKDADMLLVTTLDDIAWFLNLRGKDIQFNPIFISFLIFHKDGTCDLFIDEAKVVEVHEYLASIKVTVHPYSKIRNYLE